MSTGPGSDHPLSVFGGQPVMEGHHGRLVYDCEPHTADGCIIPVPSGFLGMPRWPEPAPGPEPAAGPDSEAEISC
jgi:hypothetical protein